MTTLNQIRNKMRANHLAEEADIAAQLQARSNITAADRQQVSIDAAALINDIRNDNSPGLMEVFLAEYGLSTDEGVALMCLAEALLRVPDADTIDELIEDKIVPSSWGEHLGKSSSSLVNASTWALMLTGKVLDDESSAGLAGTLRTAVKRLGEPAIRTAVRLAMKEMGNQFVLGETIEAAVKRGMEQEAKGFTYSYDMLGEAALTQGDAQEFFNAYENSIKTLAGCSMSKDIRENPGISVKLSALHPRYEVGQKQRILDELVGPTLTLALLAKQANMGFNIDAEESDRLDLSLDVIAAVLSDERLAGWDGFGVVVQAYSKRAPDVIDWLYGLATQLDRKIMVRLVKGAYWDTEIKRSQYEGLKNFPVFCRKSMTDVAYICCAEQLLAMQDRIYPQFATHNAHTACAVLRLADSDASFEFQRLHGMGEVMHRKLMQRAKLRCRIYAPVGAHRDLLAYLVRRLLENGANSSFVNQIVDQSVAVEAIAVDPFEVLDEDLRQTPSHISLPPNLYAPVRINSRGWDLHDELDLEQIEQARGKFATHRWVAAPLMAVPFQGSAPSEIFNPARPDDIVGTLQEATPADVEAAIGAAQSWAATHGAERAAALQKAADLYEANYGEIFAVLCREAGKSPMDVIAEIREAVDFLRYYATRTESLAERQARGIVACISPWNFPLAIFTGQIAAALAAGNGVLAKPADPTPLVATIAVKLMHQAGIPQSVLQLLPGSGSVVGAKLVADGRIGGVCFTGSLRTAKTIDRSMAQNLDPGAPLIAETGGLNAMIVDSTALPEQAVRDIMVSAFQSAGQRCSALRLLYLQEDIKDSFVKMLYGAFDELVVGDPWSFATDLGPVITQTARAEIVDYIDTAKADNRLLRQLEAPPQGTFVGPAIIEVGGIADLEKEVFGPVLHLATFKSHQIDTVVDQINDSGYGLTFGLHTRIDDRVEQITSRLNVGNMYINRNQIGAIVGSQPFGGEGLSGTGPKAGGPNYVKRFSRANGAGEVSIATGPTADKAQVQAELERLASPRRRVLQNFLLPGATGESNQLSLFPKGKILCLGPSLAAAEAQARIAASQGCATLIVCPDAQQAGSIDAYLERRELTDLHGFDAVALWSHGDDLSQARTALAAREGVIIPLIGESDMADRCVLERHICVDTTAAGGNASLLAQNTA